MADSLRANRGELHRRRLRWRGRMRAARTIGLHLATLDLREHAGRHHAALAALYSPARASSQTPYEDLDRAARTELLSRASWPATARWPPGALAAAGAGR